MSSFGRCPWRSDGAPRVTLPELAAELERQSQGQIRWTDFHPPGCENALCSFSAVYRRNGETLELVQGASSCCDCGETPSAAEGARKAKAFAARHWSAPAPPAAARDGDAFDRFLASAGIEQRFTVSCMAFQDAMTLDLERVNVVPCMMTRPFLDGWLTRCCGLDALSEESLRRYQLNKINEVLRYAERNSLLYRKRLAGVFERHGEAIRGGMWPASPDDVTQLPFTTARDLEDGWKRFVCVPLDAIARMVTLSTSGTTGEPKRLAFASADLERTLDFFAHGISVLVRPGDTVLILLPGAERPDGVTDLLIRALPRIGARGVAGNPAAEQAGFCRELELHRPDCLVAAPGQLRRLLGVHPASPGIRAILSSAEPLPQDLEEALVYGWHCEVFDHYGLTETGYGGGVECCGKQGYHLREGDLFFEVVDPVSGEPVPDGTPGEVVFTTLTRQAMPLIRYRTGDMAAMLPGPCVCGSPLRRLSRIRGRFRTVGGRLEVLAPRKGWMEDSG